MKGIFLTTCGLLPFLIGLTAILGYLYHKPSWYNWDETGTSMAFETAVCVTSLGAGMLVLGLCCIFKRVLKNVGKQIEQGGNMK